MYDPLFQHLPIHCDPVTHLYGHQDLEGGCLVRVPLLTLMPRVPGVDE
jgi:hypothetical protein